LSACYNFVIYRTHRNVRNMNSEGVKYLISLFKEMPNNVGMVVDKFYHTLAECKMS